MRSFIYLTILLLVILAAGCSSDEDDEKRREVRVDYIDVSDFLICKGSVIGADTITYNNLKERDLLIKYFDTAYVANLYADMSIEFHDNGMMTYIYPVAGSNPKKILSNYTFRNDSLFVIKTDKSEIFIALGSSKENLYLKRSMVRYPIKRGAERYDTVYSTKEEVNLEKVLKLAGYSSESEFKSPADTIAWCNMRYLLK